MHRSSDRELYEQQVAEQDLLDRLGVHVRVLHVQGAPAQAVRLGSCDEEVWPAEFEEFAWLKAESVTVVDTSGRTWPLVKGHSLYVSRVSGTRTRIDHANEIFDFAITPEQSFFTLMTDAGVFPIPRGWPFSTPYYHVTRKLEDFEREARAARLLVA